MYILYCQHRACDVKRRQRGREAGCLCLASRSYFYVCKQSKYTSPKYWCQKSGSMQVLGAFKQQSAESHPFCLSGGHAMKWDMLRIWSVPATHISVWLCSLVWARNLVNSQTSEEARKRIRDTTRIPLAVFMLWNETCCECGLSQLHIFPYDISFSSELEIWSIL